jgi:hypothetical protein
MYKGCKMQEITGYLYTNWIECQLNDDPTLTTRNRIVYARPIKIYKNIDNTLKFVFKNQDQKRIHINAYTLTMYIFSSNSFTGNQVVTNNTTSVSYADDSSLQYLDDGSSLFTDNLTGADTGALVTVELDILDDGSTSATRGIATVTIPRESLDSLTGDSYYYSVKSSTPGSFDTVIYSDDNYGVRGTVEILSGHYPA